MPNVTKVITLPAPVYAQPATARWGVMSMQFNPMTKSASVTLAAVNAAGAAVPNGSVVTFGVSGADYDAFFDATLAESLVDKVVAVGLAAGLLAQGTVVEDAQ